MPAAPSARPPAMGRGAEDHARKSTAKARLRVTPRQTRTGRLACLESCHATRIGHRAAASATTLKRRLSQIHPQPGAPADPSSPHRRARRRRRRCRGRPAPRGSGRRARCLREGMAHWRQHRQPPGQGGRSPRRAGRQRRQPPHVRAHRRDDPALWSAIPAHPPVHRLLHRARRRHLRARPTSRGAATRRRALAPAPLPPRGARGPARRRAGCHDARRLARVPRLSRAIRPPLPAPASGGAVELRA